jgi:transposase
MRPKGTAEELARRRRLAVQRVREGYRVADVARFLGVTPRAVYSWLAAARDRGDRAGLNPKLHLGPKPRLDIEQDLEILSYLLYPATSFGFPTPLWTAPRVAQLIERRFGVRYHPRYVNAWLRERGITPQKPRRKAREEDPEAIRRWLAEEWAQLSGEVAEGGWLVFIDESGLLLDPLWRRTQAPRGCPPEFAVPKGTRRKVSLIAGLAWSPSRGEVRLLSQTLRDGYFNAAQVADFLPRLLAELAGRVIVVWDRGPMHKGASIRAAKEASGGRLELKFQPAYAPRLNPVEQLWGWLKYGRLANVVAGSLWHLEAQACAELELASQDAQLLQGFFHSSELPLPENMTGPVDSNLKLAS